MKIAEQLKLLKAQMDVRHHRMFNTLAEKVQGKLESSIPGLQAQYGGKSMGNGVITASISGTVEDEDGDVGAKLQEVMNDIKMDLPSLMK